MYKLTPNPDIVFFEERNGTITRGTIDWDCYTDWLAAGNTPAPIPVPSFADYVSQFTPGLQAEMERVAGENGYDSVISCVSYKDSGVEQFAGDAAAMIAWRDAMWRWASAYQAGAGGELPDPMPTLADVVALAPKPEAFGWVVHDQTKVIESQAPTEQTS